MSDTFSHRRIWRDSMDLRITSLVPSNIPTLGILPKRGREILCFGIGSSYSLTGNISGKMELGSVPEMHLHRMVVKSELVIQLLTVCLRPRSQAPIDGITLGLCSRLNIV